MNGMDQPYLPALQAVLVTARKVSTRLSGELIYKCFSLWTQWRIFLVMKKTEPNK